MGFAFRANSIHLRYKRKINKVFVCQSVTTQSSLGPAGSENLRLDELYLNIEVDYYKTTLLI